MEKKKRKAKLFICASCEWIFEKEDKEHGGCPKCKFGFYNAHFVYGKKAYSYAISQKPWKKAKLEEMERKLEKEINATSDRKKQEKLFYRPGIIDQTQYHW